MTKISQIDDRGAVVAWSPISSCADVMVLGSKDSGGIGFEEYGGELEWYDMGITSNSGTPIKLGSVKTTSRFASIGWSPGTTGGLVAGGMMDGTVQVWNPKSILNGNNADAASSSSSLLVCSLEDRHGPVSALQFNPHTASLLATGGSQGHINVISLDQPSSPTSTPLTSSNNNNNNSVGGSNGNSSSGGGSSNLDVTSLAWNSQVPHILASAHSGGVTVWDYRQKKPWCHVRSGSSAVSKVIWNPIQGLHMLTADDSLKLWDLRASTTVPLATLESNTTTTSGGGILSAAWCPHDESLLLSCGNDNQTLLWDLHTLQPIATIPHDNTTSTTTTTNTNNNSGSAQDAFGAVSSSLMSSSQQKRYDVQWSPIRRGVLSTCSFDRKVQTHSVIGAATQSGRPPKWMKPASGVSCGFGSTIIRIDNNMNNNNNGQQQQQQQLVQIQTIMEQPMIAQLAIQLDHALVHTNPIDYSLTKAETAARQNKDEELQIWGFMQLLLEDNAREHLLHYLGLDATKIHELAMTFPTTNNKAEDDAKLLTNDINKLSLGSAKASANGGKEAELVVKQALLVGNLEAAVECCFRTGQMADALILAACGGADLWAQAQSKYLASEISKKPFLSMVQAVQSNSLKDYIIHNNNNWQETLALLCTYASADEFPQLCETLGDYLVDQGQPAHASLCYMCALHLEKASHYWIQQYLANPTHTALHQLVEKVTIFTQALQRGGGHSSSIMEGGELAEYFYQYAQLLAEQGLFVIAAKYCNYSSSQKCQELRDRIYRSKDSHACLNNLGSEPPFPFPYQAINIAPQQPTTTTQSTYNNNNTTTQSSTYGQQQQQQPAAAATTTTQSSYRQQRQSNAYGQQPATATSSSTYSQPSAYQQPTNTYTNNNNNHHHHSQTNLQQQRQQSQKSVEPTKNENELPPGWVALQDPSSGQTYYANQSTGESSWEKPAAPAAVVLQAAAATNNNPVVASSSSNATSVTHTLASKYGDGFVTSASHPELAEQYGNIGTSNPYTGTARPGTAAAVVKKNNNNATMTTTQTAPVSGTFDPTQPMENVPAEHQPLCNGLINYVCALSQVVPALSAMERKQLTEAEKGVAVFTKKIARGQILPTSTIISQVGQLFSSLQNRNYPTANAIHNALVNTEWKDQKDWLRGMRVLIQLASRRM